MTRVVVTGAAGNLGRKAVAALVRADVDVVALDSTIADGPDAGPTVQADLGTYDAAWAAAFHAADAVLHLAAEPSPRATWARVQAANVDVTNNVLRAAEEHGVGRVVLASSNWVLGGHRFSRVRLDASTPPWPVNPYGYSKAAVERAGAAFTARAGTSTLALRIGYCQPGDNRPGPHMGFGRWGQEMWLGNDDWCQAAVAACTMPFTGFAVVNVMSDNIGMRWDLGDTTRILGYRPTQGHTPQLTWRRRLEDAAAQVRARRVRPLVDASGPGARW